MRFAYGMRTGIPVPMTSIPWRRDYSKEGADWLRCVYYNGCCALQWVSDVIIVMWWLVSKCTLPSSSVAQLTSLAIMHTHLEYLYTQPGRRGYHLLEAWVPKRLLLLPSPPLFPRHQFLPLLSPRPLLITVHATNHGLVVNKPHPQHQCNQPLILPINVTQFSFQTDVHCFLMRSCLGRKKKLIRLSPSHCLLLFNTHLQHTW